MTGVTQMTRVTPFHLVTLVTLFTLVTFGLNFRNLNSNWELKMEMIVAVVITYFIVSMKKILTRPYTLTSRVGGFHDPE